MKALRALRAGVRPGSLAGKLTLLMLFALLLLVGLLAVGGTLYFREQMRNQIHEQLSGVAASRQAFVQTRVTLHRTSVTLLADRFWIRDLLSQAMRGAVGSEVQRNAQGVIREMADGDPVLSARLADITGRVVAASDPADMGQDVFGHRQFRQGLTNFSFGLPGRMDGHFVGVVSAPVVSPGTEGPALGVLLLTIDLSGMADGLRDTTGLGESGEVLLVVREGDHAHTFFPPRYRQDFPRLPLAGDPAVTAAVAEELFFGSTTDYRGERVLAAALPIGFNHWGLVAKLDEEEAYAPINRALRAGLTFAAAILLLGAGLAYALARRFTAPILRLARAVEEVRRGELQVAVPVGSADELGRLGGVFNEMTASLRARLAERDRAAAALQESEQRLRAIFDHAGVGLVEVEADDRIVAANDRLGEILGYSPAELVGRTVHELTHPEDRAGSRQLNAELHAGARDRIEYEKRYLHRSGRSVWVHVTVCPLRDGVGQWRRSIGSVEDITERKRAEAALRASEDLNRRTLAALPAHIAVTDPQGRILAVNEAWGEFARQNGACETASVAVGTNYLEVCRRSAARQDADAARALAGIESVMTGAAEQFTIEYACHSPVEPRWFVMTVVPLGGAGGNVGGAVITHLNISERKLAEEAVRESRAKLEAALASMNDAVVISDAQGRFIDFNEAFATFHRFRSKAECARTFAEYPDLLEVFLASGERAPVEQWPVPRALRGEVASNVEYILRRKETGVTWFGSYSYGPIRDKAGRIMGAVVTGRDITEMRKAEAALRESEARFRAVFEGAAVGIGRVRFTDAHWIDANDALCRMVGYSAEELLATPWPQLTHPEDVDLDLVPFQQMAAGELDGYTVEKRLIHKAGHSIWARLALSLVRDAQGRPQYEIAIVENITERKQAEEALRESEREARARAEELAAFMEAVPAITFVAHDPECRRISGSRATRQLLRVSDQSNLSKSAPESERPTHFQAMRNGHEVPPGELPMQLAAATGREVRNAELTFVFPDGTRRDIFGNAVPLFDDRGRVRGAVAAFLDITERKQMEDAAQSSLREKDVLLREIHHRVKNNLQVISSLVSLQADSLPDPALRHVFRDVRDRVRSMALVHERLYRSENVARVDFGEYTRSLLNYLWRAHGSTAAGIRLNLELEAVELPMDTAVPCGLILNELATNAIKHAFKDRAPGEVGVAVRTGPDHQIRIAVRDNGAGLAPGVDWQQTRSLGLQLVQMLARQLNATVHVNTAPGAGTKFSVTLPRPGQQT